MAECSTTSSCRSRRDHIVFNVFRYITFRTAMATVTALVISFVLGPWLIRTAARRLQHGGEHDPRGHAGAAPPKAGTPTMGGLVILAALSWLDPALGESAQPLRVDGRSWPPGASG